MLLTIFVRPGALGEHVSFVRSGDPGEQLRRVSVPFGSKLEGEAEAMILRTPDGNPHSPRSVLLYCESALFGFSIVEEPGLGKDNSKM